jgi:hypothetical protein
LTILTEIKSLMRFVGTIDGMIELFTILHCVTYVGFNPSYCKEPVCEVMPRYVCRSAEDCNTRLFLSNPPGTLLGVTNNFEHSYTCAKAPATWGPVSPQ